MPAKKPTRARTITRTAKRPAAKRGFASTVGPRGIRGISLKKALLIVGAIVVIGIVLRLTHAATGWNLVYEEKFDGSTLNTNDWTVNVNSGTSHESHHQGIYKAYNVSVHDGKLDLQSMRNCLGSGEEPTMANAALNGAVCPSGKTTVYSSGKVISKKRWNPGRVEFTAQLPSTQDGLWSALWLRNKQASWGQTYYGELDTLEWYGDQPRMYTGTSIMGANAVKSQHFLDTGIDLGRDNKAHQYAMEWGTGGIKYFFDGKEINRSNGGDKNSLDVATDFSGISAAQFQQIMNDIWEIRMETEITSPGNQWDKAPDNSKPWYPVHFLIDDVKVYAPGTGTLPTPTNNPPSVSLTSPSNGQTFKSTDSITVSANAADTDGIKSVDFYDGSTLLGTDTTAPYSVTLSGTTAGTHTFSAKATDANATSSLSTSSASVSVTVNGTTTVPQQPPTTSGTLAVPTNISATPMSGKAFVNWDDVPGANNYTVRWATHSNFDNATYSNAGATNPTTSEYTIGGLVNGRTYYISLAARDSTGKYKGSAYSTGTVTVVPGAAVTTLPAPNPPTNLTLTPTWDWYALFANPCKLAVSWKASSSTGIIGYDVSLNDKAPVRYPNTKFTMDVTSGATYKISVKAVNADNKSSAAVTSSRSVTCSFGSAN
jgi:hypothetical protein